jgi:hypothetical protein
VIAAGASSIPVKLGFRSRTEIAGWMDDSRITVRVQYWLAAEGLAPVTTLRDGEFSDAEVFVVGAADDARAVHGPRRFGTAVRRQVSAHASHAVS